MSKTQEIPLDIDLGEPSEELLEWARKNIKEDPDKVAQLIEDLRDLIYSKGECLPPRMDDDFLRRFLRARHFNLELAYTLILNYCDFCKENPYYFEGPCLKFLKENDRHNVIEVPPYRDPQGRRMVIYKFGNWKPEELSVEDFFKGTVMMMEFSNLEPRTQILGGIGILDFANITMNQAWYMTPNVAYKIFQVAVTSLPIKIMAIHILNQSWIFETGFNLFKSMLSKGMRNRIYFHGDDLESLHKYVNPKCLPEEYGGIHPRSTYDQWEVCVKKYPEVLKEMHSLGYSVDAEEVEESTH